jgi:thymidine kinase
MFVEPRNTGRNGWIEVIAGSMFSGKTEELIRRIRRAQFAQMNVEIFKPKVDVRYHETAVVSHNQNALSSTPVDSSNAILLLASNADVVGIDEAQFFDQELLSVCDQLANQGKRVIVAGLDMDFLGNPFGPMPQLLSVAEFVTKVHAICVRCGNPALYSFRTSHHQDQVFLGEKDVYEPLCRPCYHEATR